jgi:hypothetical protein
MLEFKPRYVAIVIIFVGLALAVAFLLPGCKAAVGSGAEVRVALHEAAYDATPDHSEHDDIVVAVTDLTPHGDSVYPQTRTDWESKLDDYRANP